MHVYVLTIWTCARAGRISRAFLDRAAADTAAEQYADARDDVYEKTDGPASATFNGASGLWQVSYERVAVEGEEAPRFPTAELEANAVRQVPNLMDLVELQRGKIAELQAALEKAALEKAVLEKAVLEKAAQ
ncbi:MAG: hypothetical protein GY716_15870 [bacterium]|nr:hypothetical protein [bacterium]